ncbi:GvpL/GvpF family gas vesicle protein [Streptomyces sp. NPDC046985]|uniref:GvpL/GvpF family gas vesicle protein n=1 Tax=Streptomyces sp. NPDC046985 TaxID=3155377 RepID=UPI0033E510AF
MTEQVAYAYAVLADAPGVAAALDAVRGVAEAPVHLVARSPGGALSAAVSPAPADEFQEDALRRRLEDLNWLEAVARAHHTVVEALAAHTTVLPLRLATVYRDDERVRAMLRADAEMFGQALRRLAGHVEWGVKIYLEAQPETTAAAPDPAAGLGAGRAYLRDRRVQRQAREESYRAARQAARRVEEIGQAAASGRARHRAQQGELAAGAGENIVNDAYLVTRETAEQFRAQILEAARGLPGVRIDVTGPWAPYSFAAPPGAPGQAP